MRLNNLPTLALLISACGSHSATVGERLDGVDEHTVPTSSSAQPDEESSATAATLGPVGSTSAEADGSGDSGNTGGGTGGGTGDTGGATTTPPAATVQFVPTPETPCSDTTTIGLDQSAIAERLAAWLGVQPDEELLDAVNDGELGTYGEVECQARRLVQIPEHRATLREFLGSWLDIDEPSQQNAALSAEVNSQMVTEGQTFLDHVASAPTPTLGVLLSGNQRLLGADLATHYGVEFPEGGPSALVEVPGQFGVLTLGMLTSTHARIAGRGTWIANHFECIPVGAPAADASQAIQLSASQTYRESHDVAVEPTVCQACHVAIDDPGYALENFDQLGRYRTEEAEKSIDASGSLKAFPNEQARPFDNIVELSELLAAIDEVRMCLGAKILNHASIATEQPAYDANAAIAASLLRTEELDLRELFVAATQVPAFWE